jgi:hypothetical protein
MTLTEWIFRLLAVLLILLAGLAIAWGFVADRVRGRTKQPRCPKCWYDLSGVSEFETSKWRCSECGFIATRVAQLHKSKKKWWTLAPALLLIALSPLAWAWPTIDRDGWRAAVPTWTIVHFWPIDEIAWAEGANGNDMAIELDRRIDKNLVSADLLDAWAKRVESSYNRSRVLRKSTLSGAPVLVRVDVTDLAAASSGNDVLVRSSLGLGDKDPWFEQWRLDAASGKSPAFHRHAQPPHTQLIDAIAQAGAIARTLVSFPSWTDNGGLDGTIRPCGTNLLIVNSREACDDAKQLITTLTSVVQRVNKGDVGVSMAAFDEGDHRVVVRDVGDIPLLAARPDAWADERADEVRGRITDAIDPDSWVDNGGEVGMIMTFDRLLIIRHTPEVQSRIDEQLKQWRAEAAGAAMK